MYCVHFLFTFLFTFTQLCRLHDGGLVYKARRSSLAATCLCTCLYIIIAKNQLCAQSPQTFQVWASASHCQLCGRHATTFHVKDKLHTFSLHPPPQRLPASPPVCQHMTLSPVLLTVPRPLPPYPFPYSSQYVDSNPFGHIYRYLGDPPRLQVSALSEWCCESVLEAWTNPRSAQWLWVYLDGSWDRPWAGCSHSLLARRHHDSPRHPLSTSQQ